MRLGDITRHSGRALGLSRAQIHGRSKAWRYAHGRQIVMVACRHYSRESLPKIGKHLGGRDHTTVLHGIRRVEARCAVDPAYANLVSLVCALVEIEIAARRIRQLNEPPRICRPLALLPPPPPAPAPVLQADPAPKARRHLEPGPARRVMVPA